MLHQDLVKDKCRKNLRRIRMKKEIELKKMGSTVTWASKHKRQRKHTQNTRPGDKRMQHVEIRTSHRTSEPGGDTRTRSTKSYGAKP